ncbi:DUF5986 family protein [Paenibacillus sp. FSL R5-0527]|uniref:DUF5986 family protein n=1 Tax=Paenibacillus sp. FSL R5-0527 TaxID=2975321 RepID=UPI00097AAEA5|nr:hypothetical protein BK140_27810 [Paenibacillus macerans]
MVDEDFKLLPDDYKISVIQAITDAKRIDINEFIKEFELESFNGIDFLVWDFINSNLIRNAADERLISIKVKRGRWTLVLLYDTELKYLYTLMKHKRFKQLQDQRKKRSTAHYIDALALLNDGLYAAEDQLHLFEDETWNEGVRSLLHRIVREHRDEIERFVVIGFSASKDDITSVSAIIPSSELGVVHEVDWSEFMPTNYGSSSVTIEYTPAEEEDEDIPLKLKDQPETHDDSLVNLKKDGNNVKGEED